MLVDTGADRTVFSFDVLRDLGFLGTAPDSSLGGVGGAVGSVVFSTRIGLRRETSELVEFTGEFAAFTDPTALDMSVLGRDITNMFALIIDRPQDIVCMVTQRHRYTIIAD